MFRLEGIPQADPVEEQKKVKELVKQNVFSFFFLCAAIRVLPFVLRKVAETS